MLSDSMMKARDAQKEQQISSSASNSSPAVALMTSETDEDGWGLVDESDGILILPGDDETVMLTTPVITNPRAKSRTAGEADVVPPTDLDQTRLVRNLSSNRSEFSNGDSDNDDDDDNEEEETNIPSFDPSIPTDIPSDLESLPDPDMPVSNSRSASLWSKPPTEHVTMVFPSKESSSRLSSMQGNDEGTYDDKGSQAGLSSLRQELAFAEELFGKRSSNSNSKASISWNTRTLMYAAVGVASMLVLGSSLFVYERQIWQASNNRLEERIEKLQLELMTKMETEKKQDVQRMMEFASLKQEFQHALEERERHAKEQYEAAVAAAATAAATAAAARSVEQENGPTEEHFDALHNTEEEDPAFFANSNYHKFRKLVFEMPSFHKYDDDNYHFENCWLQAEAKLGECAQEARSVFRSKLQTLGRSLWNAQENLVVKVNDFGKRVQTAAKEAAEHVLSEQQLNNQNPPWSFDKNQSFWNYGGMSNTTKQNSGSNFRTMATTLVSSVAFATLAAVVADKATTFIAGLGTEDQD